MAGRTGRRRKQQSSKNPVTGMRNMQPVTGFLLARWYFAPPRQRERPFGLQAEHLHAGVNRLLVNRSRGLGDGAERHLRLQHPAERQTEFGGDRLVDQRVVVLQGCAKPLLGERGPHGELQHAGGITGESGEVRSVGREVLLQLCLVTSVSS